MPSSIPPEARQAFSSLAELVYAESHPHDILDTLCRAALQIIPGADHACVSTLEAPGRLRTVAASDEVAGLMDQLENEAGEGPCLDSITEDSFQRDEDITVSSQWPRLARLTLARTPVRGMVGYRLLPDVGAPSAFNVFADAPAALSAEAADVGAVLAAFASIALTAAEQREKAESLRRGLESNREIGKAIGILMATHSISDDEAFNLLRAASNRMNTKVAEIANRITEGGRDQRP